MAPVTITSVLVSEHGGRSDISTREADMVMEAGTVMMDCKAMRQRHQSKSGREQEGSVPRAPGQMQTCRCVVSLVTSRAMSKGLSTVGVAQPQESIYGVASL